MSFNKVLTVTSSLRNYSVIETDNITELSSGNNSFVIIDEKVLSLYCNKLRGLLVPDRILPFEATEGVKTLSYAGIIIEALLNKGIKKNSLLIAIGGGIIQDLAGFIASILFRGIEWVFCPTTLLSQCDSCIGSKTSINFGRFKNQLGTFYPPSRIIWDSSFLKTLSETDIKSGLGEIIKVHFLDGEKSLDYINSHYPQDASDFSCLRDLALRSLKIKKKVIEKDEFDKDYRNILNYGHTFGHAIESITDYKVCHGQAVTIGMDMANYISREMGLLPEKTYKVMQEVLRRNMPEFALGQEQIEPLLSAMSKDKKNDDGNITLILTEGAGRMSKEKVAPGIVGKLLELYRGIKGGNQ